MNLGGPEVLVILVIALLILGPEKLPGALRMIGRAMGEFKKYQDLAKNEIEKAMNTPVEDQGYTNKSRMEDKGEEETVTEINVGLKGQCDTTNDGGIVNTGSSIIAPIVDDEDE